MNMLVDHIYTSKLATQPDRFSNFIFIELYFTL